MGYLCEVPGCKSNNKKDEPNATVFKFPIIGELRQKWLPRKSLTGPGLTSISYSTSDTAKIH